MISATSLLVRLLLTVPISAIGIVWGASWIPRARPLNWGWSGVIAGGLLPLILGAACLASLIHLAVARRRGLRPVPVLRAVAWFGALAMVVIGYFAFADSMSFHMTRNGCFTGLQLHMTGLQPLSWIRNAEQGLGSLLFFGAPLLLVWHRTNPLVPPEE